MNGLCEDEMKLPSVIVNPRRLYQKLSGAHRNGLPLAKIWTIWATERITAVYWNTLNIFRPGARKDTEESLLESVLCPTLYYPDTASPEADGRSVDS